MIKRKNRRQIPPQAILDAKLAPGAPEGLEYKVSANTKGDHIEVFARHPFSAMMAAEALANRFNTDSYVMLGTREVAVQSPRRRRK